MLEGLERIFGNGHVQVLAEMDFSDTCTRPGFLLRALHFAQALFLLGQRRVQRGVGIVLVETGGGQLGGCRRKDGFPEVLRSQLAHKSQACRGEEHLLAHGGCVGNVGHGHEGRGFSVPSQNNVERFIGFDVGGEEGVDIGGKRGARG